MKYFKEYKEDNNLFYSEDWNRKKVCKKQHQALRNARKNKRIQWQFEI